jgi:hypothetical protein
MRDRAAEIADVTVGVRHHTLRVLARFAVMAAVAYVIAYEPIVPFFPVCYEEGSDGPVRHTLYGPVSDEFARALRFHQYPERRRHVGGLMLMPVREWMFGFWYPNGLTTAAVWRLVSARHDLDRDAVFTRDGRLPGFERRWPTCEAVREIALVSGKWSREGPSPIWYKRAGMPRPVGFIDAQVPAHSRGDPVPDRGDLFLVDLGVAFAFGLGVGCLLAT